MIYKHLLVGAGVCAVTLLGVQPTVLASGDVGIETDTGSSVSAPLDQAGPVAQAASSDTEDSGAAKVNRGGGGGGGHGGGGGGHFGGGGHGGGYGHGGYGHGGYGHGGYGHGGYGHGGYGHGGYGHGYGHGVHFGIGRRPFGGFRGNRFFYGGLYYNVWDWGPWAPWYGWADYTGWQLGLDYYVPEGLKCIATNSQVAGQWSGDEETYASDDAINDAIGACQNDSYVVTAGAQSSCRIKTCVEWDGRDGN